MEDEMSKDGNLIVVVREAAAAAVANLDEYSLRDLEEAIEVRRLNLLSDSVRAAGLPVRTEGRGCQFRFACVYPPDDSAPGVWADAGELRRLMDTLHNLPPAEAFRRWAPKVSPAPADAPYGEAEARTAIRAERTRLQDEYQAGRISAGDLKLEWGWAREYLAP